ncbi:hypothetical protein BDZ45DRAFT_391354 [Acephala macrosclerotiorum]|nr:hypothetical protein BDZ45DRAFT_391354 [Acephala macrosclerotiorum]
MLIPISISREMTRQMRRGFLTRTKPTRQNTTSTKRRCSTRTSLQTRTTAIVACSSSTSLRNAYTNTANTQGRILTRHSKPSLSPFSKPSSTSS